MRQLVIELDGVSEAKRLAEKYTEKSLKKIKSLPDTKEKAIIYQLTKQLLSRKI